MKTILSDLVLTSAAENDRQWRNSLFRNTNAEGITVATRAAAIALLLRTFVIGRSEGYQITN